MDRLFLDANILLSAAYGSPSMEALWQAARNGKVRLLTSAYALEEAERNLDPPQRSRLELLAGEVATVPECAGLLDLDVDLPAGDRAILAAAVYAGATHLITGDRRHFGRLYGSTFGGVLVCSPRQCLPRLQQGA